MKKPTLFFEENEVENGDKEDAEEQPSESKTTTGTLRQGEDLVAQQRFALYQPLFARIISRSGSYPESDLTSYESGLELILKVVRRIFWPNAAQPWGRVLEFHREPHGVDLKRRVLYYLAGALWNQFREEMQSTNPRTHRQQAWFGAVSSDVEVSVSRAPPSHSHL